MHRLIVICMVALLAFGATVQAQAQEQRDRNWLCDPNDDCTGAIIAGTAAAALLGVGIYVATKKKKTSP